MPARIQGCSSLLAGTVCPGRRQTCICQTNSGGEGRIAGKVERAVVPTDITRNLECHSGQVSNTDAYAAIRRDVIRGCGLSAKIEREHSGGADSYIDAGSTVVTDSAGAAVYFRPMEGRESNT